MRDEAPLVTATRPLYLGRTRVWRARRAARIAEPGQLGRLNTCTLMVYAPVTSR